MSVFCTIRDCFLFESFEASIAVCISGELFILDETSRQVSRVNWYACVILPVLSIFTTSPYPVRSQKPSLVKVEEFDSPPQPVRERPNNNSVMTIVLFEPSIVWMDLFISISLVNIYKENSSIAAL